MSPFDTAPADAAPSGLADRFGRRIDTLQLSVADACGEGCARCSPRSAAPRAEMLTLDELDRLSEAFILGLGVRRLRLAGEPLARKGAADLARRLSRHLGAGALDELTLATTGSRLAEHARGLADAGVTRIDLSLDSLDPRTFHRITGGGDLRAVLEGLDAARRAGLAVEVRTTALARDNAHDLPAMIDWAHGRDLGLTLVEAAADRTDQHLPLSRARADLESFWTLEPLPEPAHAVWVKETAGRLTFAPPTTDDPAARVSCTGEMILGHAGAFDLREPLRANPGDDRLLLAAIRRAAARA